MKNKSVKPTYFIAVLVVLLLISLYGNYHLSDDKEIIKRFNNLYIQSGALVNTYWMGINSVQTPGDNWMMQELIYEVKPDFIIETGTYTGGTALYYAMLLEHINKNGKIITVDIKDYKNKSELEYDVFNERVECIIGDSVGKETIDKIKSKVENHKVIVMLDSLHTKEHVLKEIELYSQFVSKGSYLVVADTFLSTMSKSLRKDLKKAGWHNSKQGPMEAVNEFLKTNKNFIIDKSKEKFLNTQHPSGYLKRIK
jgi:cephalosporin hydroxylase